MREHLERLPHVQVVPEHFGRHRDAERYLSLPGLGPVLGARILGEFGDDPHHYADGKARRNYAGTSPITRASGSRRVVLARYARNRGRHSRWLNPQAVRHPELADERAPTLG